MGAIGDSYHFFGSETLSDRFWERGKHKTKQVKLGIVKIYERTFWVFWKIFLGKHAEKNLNYKKRKTKPFDSLSSDDSDIRNDRCAHPPPRWVGHTFADEVANWVTRKGSMENGWMGYFGVGGWGCGWGWDWVLTYAPDSSKIWQHLPHKKKHENSTVFIAEGKSIHFCIKGAWLLIPKKCAFNEIGTATTVLVKNSSIDEDDEEDAPRVPARSMLGIPRPFNYDPNPNPDAEEKGGPDKEKFAPFERLLKKTTLLQYKKITCCGRYGASNTNKSTFMKVKRAGTRRARHIGFLQKHILMQSLGRIGFPIGSNLIGKHSKRWW